MGIIMSDFEDLLAIILQNEPDIDTVQELVNSGININQQHEQAGTPLMIAASLQKPRMVKVLLELGADCAQAHHQVLMTALHFACGNGSTEIIQELLRHGAPIEALDNQGWTPLMFAAQEGHLDAVELLLANGVVVDATDQMGRTALMQAARCGHTQIADRLIVEGADVNAKCGWSTPLIMSATAGHTDVGELLIRHGAEIEELDEKEGYSPLMMAALGGHKEFVNLLIEKGADVNLSTEWNVTAMTMAHRGSHEYVEAILEQAGAIEPEPVPCPFCSHLDGLEIPYSANRCRKSEGKERGSTWTFYERQVVYCRTFCSVFLPL